MIEYLPTFRNQDTFIITLIPLPPYNKAFYQTLRAHWTLKTWGRGRSKQIDCALHSSPKFTSHSYVRFWSIKEISYRFAEKRPEQQYLPAEILKKIDFWRFWKSKIGTVPIKSGRLAGIWLGRPVKRAYRETMDWSFSEAGNGAEQKKLFPLQNL